jgi:hypothetical protein
MALKGGECELVTKLLPSLCRMASDMQARTNEKKLMDDVVVCRRDPGLNHTMVQPRTPTFRNTHAARKKGPLTLMLQQPTGREMEPAARFASWCASTYFLVVFGLHYSPRRGTSQV